MNTSPANNLFIFTVFNFSPTTLAPVTRPYLNSLQVPFHASKLALKRHHSSQVIAQALRGFNHFGLLFHPRLTLITLEVVVLDVKGRFQVLFLLSSQLHELFPPRVKIETQGTLSTNRIVLIVGRLNTHQILAFTCCLAGLLSGGFGLCYSCLRSAAAQPRDSHR